MHQTAHHNRRVAVRRVLVALALAVAAALSTPGIASARPGGSSGTSEVVPYFGYNLKYVCHYGNCDRGEVLVEVWGDVLYSDTTFIATHTRGYGKITNRTALRVRIDKVNLGSKFGVEQTGVATSSTTGVARRATPWDSLVDASGNPNPAAPCDYHVRVYFSVRWRDGTLGRGSLLSDWYENPNAPTCRS